MHTLAVLALAPVIAAEKSKTPFYIAGGALVLWALIVSLVLGLRKPEFPGGLEGQRIVCAITAVLVLGAAGTAVATSGGEGAGQAAAAAESTSTPAQQTPAPATPTAPATSTAPAPAAPAPKSAATTPAAKKPAAKPAPATVFTALSLEANSGGQLLYNTKQLKAKAGTVRISFANNSPVEHNVTIVKGTTTLGATPTFTGGSKSVTVQLKPGTYTFYCSVPGHRQAGMEGTLTIS